LIFSDISATSFFKPVTVIKFVEEFLSIRDTSRPLSDRDRVKVKISMLRICKTSCTVQQAIGCHLLTKSCLTVMMFR
jgi:hypothetical protein